MKSILRNTVCGLSMFLLVHSAQAQHSKSSNVKAVLTADSLATGNWKDVLTSFFQLSFDKLTGQRKELNFQSNPFAILLRANPDAAIDTNYHKYKILRKLNFGFGLNLDSSYRFNGFSSGVRYALINKRDTTTSKLLFRGLGNDSLNIQINALQVAMEKRIETAFPGDANLERRQKLFASLNTLMNDKTVPFNKLDSAFQTMVKETAKSENLGWVLNLVSKKPQVSLAKESELHFIDLKKELQNALLWTVSLTDTTYKSQFFFSNILLKTELLKGIGKYKPGSNIELNMQAGVNFVDDSTVNGRDLKRSLLHFEPGFNWVFRNRVNDQSFFELKFSGSYMHNFGNLYRNERRDSVTVNATLRVRIIGDIWIPLEIKYDPRSGNVFGFLNVRANFNGFRKQMAGS
jgi:hypothetical protein